MDDKIKLERMAILKEFRTKIMETLYFTIKRILFCIRFFTNNLDSIYSVKDFYKKCGFIEEGEIFKRVGIDHIRMSLKF